MSITSGKYFLCFRGLDRIDPEKNKVVHWYVKIIFVHTGNDW
jgi:hypothetical protein